MNCFDSTLDKLGRSVSLDSGFSDLKSRCNLRDAWRLLHPETGSSPGSAQIIQLPADWIPFWSRVFCVIKSLGAIFSHAFSQIMTLLF